MRRTLVTTLALVAAVGACTDDAPSPAEPVATTLAESRAPARLATYQVTITNLTAGQPFTPPVIATHSPRMKLWTRGRPASMEVQQIAENGNLPPMLDRLGASPLVHAFLVAEGPTAPPLLPGETLVREIEASRAARFLSVISMLICTNDGFTGVTHARLPEVVGRSRSWSVGGYDAGTEINTEDFADMVPPCAALTGVPSTDPGTGMTDPALAEGGVVRHHDGIAGIADLVPAIHGWQGPVARIEVTRVN